MTDSTGPNTSSRAIRIGGSTSTKIVGSTNWPPGSSAAVAGPPPRMQRAPSALAMSM